MDAADLAGKIAAFVVVLGATLFVFFEVQPKLIFGPNMDVGGDNAGHVVAVYYFIHHLLPHGQLSGWDPQWFDGFPLYVFYFPLPALLIAALNSVFSYAVAFKIVTVLGSVLLPVAAWAFGRLARFPRPVPALMAAATIPFLFNTSYEIDGGNLASTLAGEFSFSLALVVGLLFLGVFIRSLETGRLRWLAAVLFAATALCHVVPALYFGGAAIVLTIARLDWRRLKTLIPVGVVGVLLAAFWLLPFRAYARYSSSMGYTRVGGLVQPLLPRGYLWVIICAGVGAVIAVVLRNRTAIAMIVLAAAAAVAFGYLPAGQVYNGRWLPFWFLMTALLAAYGVAQVVLLLCRPLQFQHWEGAIGATTGGVVMIGVVAASLNLLPLFHPPTSFLPSWVSWNYTGYQGKPGWKEFQGLVAMLDRVGAKYGCGRLDYEYSPGTENSFGSTDSFMSIPLWTNGCMGTAEGLYYESSTTTPYHFLDQPEFSLQPSDPVVGIPYQSFNIADGIRHLQLMGVRYFLASSAPAEKAAQADPSLVFVGSAPASTVVADVDATNSSPAPKHPTWQLYEIKNTTLVAPLAYQPVVEPGEFPSQPVADPPATAWYQTEEDWPVLLAQSGPASWQRAPAGELFSPQQAVPLPTTTVSHVATTDESISFDVARLGVPIVVRIPYFPNWHASGASGPYEVTPNLMVVVPTAHHVSLVYGTTTIDWLGRAGSVLGLVGVGALALIGPARYPPEPPEPVDPFPLRTPPFPASLELEAASGDEDGERLDSPPDDGVPPGSELPEHGIWF